MNSIAAITKGIGQGLARSIAPKTTGFISQGIDIAKSLGKYGKYVRKSEKKKAGDLMGLKL